MASPYNSQISALPYQALPDHQAPLEPLHANSCFLGPSLAWLSRFLIVTPSWSFGSKPKSFANYFLPLISQCICYFPSIMTHLAATEQLGRPQNIDFLSGRNVRTNSFSCLSWAVSWSMMGRTLQGLGRICGQDSGVLNRSSKASCVQM